MKIVIRIFNVLIMALSVVAGVFLFMPPAFSFNSKVTIDVKTFSQFVPETEYSKDIKIEELLGTDSIYVGIKFQLDVQGIGEMKDGDRDRINDTLIADNVKEMVQLLHEPVDLITDIFIRQNIKKIVSEQVTTYVEQAIDSYRAQYPEEVKSSAQDIMKDCGIDDDYFTTFSYSLYDACNDQNATLDSAGDTLNEQINEALVRAEDSGVVDNSVFGDEQKAAAKNSLAGVLQNLNLVESDGQHIKPISEISYIYLSDYLKNELKDTVDASELEQRADERAPAYSDRLLELFVKTKMPDMFYQIVGYVCLGLFIAVFVFAGVWAILFLITLIKTFSKEKPWTIFGPWFWLVGIVELIVGFGLTAICKFALSKFDISKFGLPIQEVLVSLKTYALIPSIIFAACIVVAIIYSVLRSICKKGA